MMRIPKPGVIHWHFKTRRKEQKAVLKATEIEAILAHYDLGDWVVCANLGGGNSDNVLLQTSRGKKVLKRYRWPWPAAMTEHSILRHLADTDFPFSRLEVNEAGLTYTELGDKNYAIYDFISGYCSNHYFMPMATRKELVIQAAETLARFHQLVKGFVPEGRKFGGFKPDGKTLWRDVDWYLNVLDQYVEGTAQKKSFSEFDEFLLSIVDEFKAELIEVGRHYEQNNPQLPKVVIHGDYSPKNLLFNQTKLKTVLDFGDSCLNLRALDVIRGLTTFSNIDKYGRVGGYNINEDLARSFGQAYQAKEPLFDQELEAIPDLIRWRRLRNLAERLAQINSDSYPQFKKRKTSFKDIWTETCWLKTQSDKIWQALS